MEASNQEYPSCYDFSLMNEELNAQINNIIQLEAKIENISNCYSLKPWSFNENLYIIKADLQNDLKNVALFKKDNYDIIKNISEYFPIYSQYLSHFKNFSQKIENFFSQVDYDLKHCYSFSFDKKTELSIYNLELKQKEKVLIEDLQRIDSNSCLIRIPNNELFCYGNKGSLFSGSLFSCIIDLKTFAIKKVLSNWNSCIGAGGIYLDNKVILFGGFHRNDFLSDCFQFNLLSNRWAQMPPILKDSYHVSCIAFRGKILLCGFGHESIYQYDLNIESCSEISSINLSPLKNKSLTIGNSRVYILECKGRIFESETEDEYMWNLIGNMPQENLVPLKLYNQTLIFVDTTSTKEILFYKFDLIAKEVKRIWH